MPETACGAVAGEGNSFRQIQLKKGGSCKQLTLDLQKKAVSDDCITLERALARTEEQCRHLEMQLSGAMAAAQAADRAKSDFLNLMNHEVRTPMNGIVALVELLNSLPKSKQQQEYLNGIQASSDSLLHIINNIIDYSHLASGELALEDESFSPRAVIEEAVGPLLKLPKENIDYIQDVEETVPALLRGDPRRLRQIIGNLISNAIKFTEQGTIRLSLHLTQQTDTHATLHFTIADTGTGIPPGFRERIFDPFIQADSSSTRKCGGAGLGLTIARQLAELMGGSIRLGRESDKGSTFHFDVPLKMDIRQETTACSAEKDQRSLLQWGGRSLHILLAEDHETNRNLTEKILRRLGHTVSAAYNGKKAVDINEQESFDLILMDMEMPEMDGWEATSIIRKREAAGTRHVPIIAVTAHAIKGNREMLMASGFDGYMSKPIDFVALTREMKRLASTIVTGVPPRP
ncbi:ATP-binding protein [Pelotalea chapellei]|uniref:histidine kinase n=1 Tax=Pelotalea chapellei TaxID=44671 RepID=A0ABS5U883_9BACT|nr:ATP-binding protein [Pelotalea chapellei]MBT1071883.1 response regulator [Pelotalea chapellei]